MLKRNLDHLKGLGKKRLPKNLRKKIEIKHEDMPKDYTSDGVKIEWLGHAGFKIKGKNVVIYIDPYMISGDVEKADLILITHDHYDHCDPESVDKIKKEGTVIVTTGEAVKKLGAGKKIGAGESITEKGVKIKAVHAYNIGKHFHPEGYGLGFVIRVDGLNIYHAGDTDHIYEMKNLGGIDVALLPVGGTYTMSEEEAAKAVDMIKPKTAIPMHYGTITSGDPEKFKKLVKSKTKVVIL